MPDQPSHRADPSRVGLVFLALAFLALVAIGVVTVILPELADDSEPDLEAAGDIRSPPTDTPAPGPTPPSPTPSP